MRRLVGLACACVLLGSSGLLVSANPASGGPPPESQAAAGSVSSPATPSRTTRVKDLPPGSRGAGSQTTDRSTPGSTASHKTDTALQTSTAPAGEANDDLTGPIRSFAGQSSPFAPPDTVGDVGPNHYVQMVNATFQVWDKQGTSLAGPTNINALFQNPAFNGCRTQNAGDPIVLYDQTVDRWMLAQFTSPNAAPFAMCIAYSQTPDPTGTYFAYEFVLPASHDYMKFGIWSDGLFMSTFEGSGQLGAYAFDRSALVSGSPASFQYFGSGAGALGTGIPDTARSRAFPSDWDGVNPPAAGEPNHFLVSRDAGVGQAAADQIEMWDFDVDWTNPANTTFGLVTTLPTAPFDVDLGCDNASGLNPPVNRNCVPQPGVGALRVDSLPGRLMHRVQYRNFGTYQSMVASQSSVDADGANRAGMRWYELRDSGAGWSIHQQGTYAPGTAHRWMGSVAMDGKGNIAMGYSLTDPTAATPLFPSVAYTGRLASAPLGSMPEPEKFLLRNTAGPAEAVSPRWGDYSSLNVDPTDDCTFWYTNEFSPNRQTQIGSFRFASCDSTDLRLTKTDAPDPVVAGEVLTYTLQTSNAGPTTARGVTLTDVLPAGVTLVGTSTACTNASGTLTCGLGNLLPGQSASVAVQVSIPPDYLGAATSGVVTNSASVAATNQGDPAPGNNTAVATTTVLAKADMAVTKVCKPDQPATAGSTGYCDIHVDNLGPSDGRDVSLSDVLTSATPFSVTGATVTPASSGSCGPTSAGPATSITVSCSLGTEPAKGRTTIRISVTASDVAQINDVATVSSATPDPATGNNQSSGRVEFVGSADLRLTKTGPASAVAGTPVSYTITVTDDGPSTARNVSVTDVLPLGVSFVSVTSSQGSCTNGQPDARTLRCGLGDLAPGSTATITVNGLVAADVLSGTVLFNEAVASSATEDPNNANNRASVGTPVTTLANLSVSKTSSPNPVTAGNPLTYTIAAGNAGPSVARAVEVSDTLPAGTTYVSGKDASGATICTLVQSDRVVCALGDLAPGASRTVFLTVLVAPSAAKDSVLRNAAVVGSTTPDPDTSNNTATTDTVVGTSADLWLDKQATQRSGNPSPVLVYSLVVHNDKGCEKDAQSTSTPNCGSGGPSDAQDVVVTDRLPLDPKKLVVQYVSPSCTYVKITHTVTCRIATLPAGADTTFVIEAQVSGSVGTISNTASATSATADPVAGNGTNTATVVIKGGTGKR